MTDVAAPTTRFERKDANLTAIFLIGAGLAAAIIATCLVSWWIFDILQARDRAAKVSQFPLASQQRRELPPEPRLEQIDRLSGKAETGEGRLYVKEQQRLDSYGWVDEKAGVVHLPIDKAMRILVEEKRLPAR